jgi:hypothetical protein
VETLHTVALKPVHIKMHTKILGQDQIAITFCLLRVFAREITAFMDGRYIEKWHWTDKLDMWH